MDRRAARGEAPGCSIPPRQKGDKPPVAQIRQIITSSDIPGIVKYKVADMTKISTVSLVLSVLAQTFGVNAWAKDEKGMAPLYLSCDGIISDQRVLKVFKVTSNAVLVWNSGQLKWGLLCGEQTGPCSINEKTISFASGNGSISILRSTGQFESQLSNGSTWMGACTETTDPGLSAKPNPH